MTFTYYLTEKYIYLFIYYANFQKQKNGKIEILLLKDIVKEFLHANRLNQRFNIIFIKNNNQNAMSR